MENSCVTLLDTPAAGISFAESADQKSTFSVGVQHFPRSSYVNENLPNWIGERLLVTVQGVAIHCIDVSFGSRNVEKCNLRTRLVEIRKMPKILVTLAPNHFNSGGNRMARLSY